MAPRFSEARPALITCVLYERKPLSCLTRLFLPKFLLSHVISPFIFANLTLKPCLEAVLASASALHFDVNDPSQSSGLIASSPSPPGSTPLSSEDGSMGQVAVAMLTSTGHCPFLLPIERSHSLFCLYHFLRQLIITCFSPRFFLFRFRPFHSKRIADQSTTRAADNQTIGGPGKCPLSSV